MKSSAFELKHARTLGEATELLAGADGNAKVLAGGQSLVPMLNLRLARPKLLVDIKRASGFRELAADDKVFSIGAGWTHAEIEDGVLEDPTCGLLRSVAHGIAYRAVRNRGTMGGSLAHADPAADWVSTLAALGAVIVAQGGEEQPKRYAAESFVDGAFSTKLGESEVIAAIEVPRLSADASWAYHKICRKTGEFANAIGVAVLDQKAGIKRVLAGATSGSPALLPETAARLAEAGPGAAWEIGGEELYLIYISEATRQAENPDCGFLLQK
ncbi:FAD binding domain-containing protein [Bradyrhizobium uaiense]|uniref:Carbon monoxide dehydrogenase n=1 Tax=Bradyrhizobium uaiense TaxID=2594946 RepID=A0A6P1BG20_9BRAD|nr:FAD binding domain-containing protein [Bradyrhizobium uaiense]NEU97124.1 carbon monoxide dehydrogenase [Bradyrhizobium uaiense]